jgi:hypothetical protein
MNVKDELLATGVFVVGNGLRTSFWEDSWLGEKPLPEEYPSLYKTVYHKNFTVAHVLESAPLNIWFRQTR